MARRATGKVIAKLGADGQTYRSLRFTAYGKRRYVSLGPVSEAQAERELSHVLADVERGIWQPLCVEPAQEAEPPPCFHEYAEEWWLRNESRFAHSTQLDYRWRLECHLLPYFKDHRLDQITYDEVERYIASKLAGSKPLGARSVNMTVTLLAAILETAVERDLIARNPARGKRRRVPERTPRRSYLETGAPDAPPLLVRVGELYEQVAVAGLRRAPAAEYQPSQLVERVDQLVLLAQPLLVALDALPAGAVLADDVRVAPLAGSADVEVVALPLAVHHAGRLEINLGGDEQVG